MLIFILDIYKFSILSYPDLIFARFKWIIWWRKLHLVEFLRLSILPALEVTTT